MAQGPRDCASAPSAYRAGNESWQMGQGQSPATSADPLVQRQSPCRKTSDGKPWQTDTWGRRGNLGDPSEESNGSLHAPPTRLSCPTTQARVHSEIERSASSGYSDRLRPRDAG